MATSKHEGERREWEEDEAKGCEAALSCAPARRSPSDLHAGHHLRVGWDQELGGVEGRRV